MVATPLRREQAQIVRTLGARMREARNLCNLPVGKAARRLGLEPAQLQQIEGAIDTETVPLWILERASRIYSVSASYLFGHTDDFEDSTVTRDLQTWFFMSSVWCREGLGIALTRVDRRIKFATEQLPELLDDFSILSERFAAFVQANPEFEDMPRGAPLLASIERLQARADDARAAVRRLKLGLQADARNSENAPNQAGNDAENADNPTRSEP